MKWNVFWSYNLVKILKAMENQYLLIGVDRCKINIQTAMENHQSLFMDKSYFLNGAFSISQTVSLPEGMTERKGAVEKTACFCYCYFEARFDFRPMIVEILVLYLSKL